MVFDFAAQPAGAHLTPRSYAGLDPSHCSRRGGLGGLSSELQSTSATSHSVDSPAYQRRLDPPFGSEAAAPPPPRRTCRGVGDDCGQALIPQVRPGPRPVPRAALGGRPVRRPIISANPLSSVRVLQANIFGQYNTRRSRALEASTPSSGRSERRTDRVRRDRRNRRPPVGLAHRGSRIPRQSRSSHPSGGDYRLPSAAAAPTRILESILCRL